MSISSDRKQEIIKRFSTSQKDTGSAEAQVSLLTERINSLTYHLETHKKDFHSRRGLLVLVGRRRGLLNYLKVKNYDRYSILIKGLSLRH